MSLPHVPMMLNCSKDGMHVCRSLQSGSSRVCGTSGQLWILVACLPHTPPSAQYAPSSCNSMCHVEAAVKCYANFICQLLAEAHEAGDC